MLANYPRLASDEEMAALAALVNNGLMPPAPPDPAEKAETKFSDLYGPEYSDEKRTQILNKKPSTGNLIAQGFAGLGDAITSAYGRSPTKALSTIQAGNEAAREKVLAGFDENRSNRVKEYLMNKQDRERSEDRAFEREKFNATLEEKEQARKDAAAERQLRREEMRASRKEKLDQKAEQDFEKNIQKLQDKLEGAQAMDQALKGVEASLGFKLDEADTKGGNLTVGGKEKDLPGVNVPGLGRVSAYSSGARDLAKSVARVFNVELKDRSGAAVTNPEMERMKTEFASGKFNTEPELIQAMKEYKGMMNAELVRREAAFKPEVLSEYERRGGVTSRTSAGASKPEGPKMYRVKAPNGRVFNVPEKDLKGALDAGGQVI